MKPDNVIKYLWQQAFVILIEFRLYFGQQISPTPAPSEKKQLILAFLGGSGVMRKKARKERKFLLNDLRTIK